MSIKRLELLREITPNWMSVRISFSFIDCLQLVACVGSVKFSIYRAVGSKFVLVRLIAT